MVGSFLPARFSARGAIVVLAVAGMLFAVAPGASAASSSPITSFSATQLIEDLREHARATGPVLATVAGQELLLPRAVRKIGFHESGNPAALAMSPVGRLEENLNAGRVSLPAVNGDRDGGYIVLPTRHRGGAPTTAVDLSMRENEPVTSPVTGEVTAANDYSLYGKTRDTIIEIAPDGRPELRVRMMHVEGVGVQPGDRVEAGRTPVAARSRALPFGSQIDRYAGTHPHVHLEVLHRQ